MAIVSPLALRIDTIWALVATWGLGSVVAALIAGSGLPIGRSGQSSALTWFRDDALPFGRWLAVQEGAFLLGLYGLTLALTGILGPADVGGLRAADSVFAPLSLLSPALVLVGLPALSRAASESFESALRLATAISVGCVALTLAYAVLMVVAGERILEALFGGDFHEYGSLALSMSMWQVLLAAGIGFSILLRAERAGRRIVVISAMFAATTFGASTALAEAYGVHGAVWGLSAGAFVGTSLVIWSSFRGVGSKSSDDSRGSGATPPL
jgi:O-antigen/teichoic acid export membrane protein